MDYITPELRLEFREFCVDLYLRQIDDIFRMAHIAIGSIPPDRNVNGDRRTRVEEYYSTIDWSNRDDTEKFLVAIGLTLSQSYLPDERKTYIKQLCEKSGLRIEGHKVLLCDEAATTEKNLFRKQFPAGLPFGKIKPAFSIKATNGAQSLSFEKQSGIDILEGDIYPNLTFTLFQHTRGIDRSTNLELKHSLLAMNQTDCEVRFFRRYANLFNMATSEVPMLVPQAWIQWHSSTKRNLREAKSSHADELYRVDFVAFWGNQRYAILVDDISHFAKKVHEKWEANEEAYAKRLKEDRKLQANGWNVFRASNWEIRDESRLDEILLDLRVFVGFGAEDD